MKTIKQLFWGGQILLAALLSGCAESVSDNTRLDYTQLDVNFEATVPGNPLSTEEAVAVFATCSRGADTEVIMSKNYPAYFIPVSEGNQVNLIKKSDADNILAYAGDHNFKFDAFYPITAYNADVTSLKANIPSVVEYGSTDRSLQVAKASKTSVVAPIGLNFQSIAANMVMNVPGNILGNDTLPVLKSIELKPYDPTEFVGMLAFDATYNLISGELNIDEESAKTSILVDFGAKGLALKTGYTAVSFDVAPLTVPFGGFLVVVTDVDGNQVESEVFVNDGGRTFKAGETVEFNLTRPGEDGITASKSPVEWPVGYENANARALKDNFVDMWPINAVNKGIAGDSHVWKNVSQPQATATWIVSSDNPSPKNIGYEFNNFSQYNYASPCVKGIWTGDGMEFSVPVKNIPEGTKVTLTLPAYGRGAPIFWNVEYLDGTQWKCNKTLQSSPDGQFEMECTWVIPHGNVNKLWAGHIMTHTMTLENPIRSGYIRVRFVCASGEYTTAAVSEAGNNTCYNVKNCAYDGSHLFAFVNIDDICKAVTISWE